MEAASLGELDAGTVLVGLDEERRQHVQAALEDVLIEWAHKCERSAYPTHSHHNMHWLPKRSLCTVHK